MEKNTKKPVMRYEKGRKYQDYAVKNIIGPSETKPLEPPETKPLGPSETKSKGKNSDKSA